ncbi:MAG: DUF2090 domain-containing protein [bacterium]|nr:DUF2090 domain-containing protein [bacterium]
MNMPLGYDKPLYLLPFDHRATFKKELFGIEGEPSPAAREEIRTYKRLVYEALKEALRLGVPREGAALLVDEEYGADIIRDAHILGLTTCLTVEKSGKDEFEFEYGNEFGAHVKRLNPVFAKALVRYNPEGDKELNARQRGKLALFSAFCRKEGYKLLLEPLVHPTHEHLIAVTGERNRFDRELRPGLTLAMMRELQDAGIEPDVWKLEGMEERGNYAKIVAIARNSKARAMVGTIILGRGEGRREVETWLRAGRGVDGIIGFAVGRTVFLEPLRDFKAKRLGEREVIRVMAENYRHFYDIFVGKS